MIRNNSLVKVALFLNGKSENSFPKKISNYKKIFVTDGGYTGFFKKYKIYPDLVIGDFDSINKKLIFSKKINIIYKSNQNITDFEKALNYIYKNNFFNVDVWGASGKEQDHFLGNLYVALKYKNKLSLIFYDKHQIYFFAKKKNLIHNVKGKKISLFPFPETYGVKTIGLKYPILNDSLKIIKKIGIRNIAINNDIEIIYTKGVLLIFIENKLNF